MGNIISFDKHFATVELEDKVVDFFHSNTLMFPPALPQKLEVMAKCVNIELMFKSTNYEDSVIARVRDNGKKE